MKNTVLLLLLSLLLTACGDTPSDHDSASADHKQKSRASSAEAAATVELVDGVTVIEMTGNDRMKYNIDAFTVPAGSPVKLTFRNVGKMPKAAMGHNVVFLVAGTNSAKFATAAASARDQDYIPSELENQIFAHTKLLGAGESDTIEFTAPETAGDYEFICSFPAHMYAGMRGVMTVQSVD